MLGNGPQVLGNGNVLLVLGNGPHLLGILLHSGFCPIRYFVVRDYVAFGVILFRIMSFGVMSLGLLSVYQIFASITFVRKISFL